MPKQHRINDRMVVDWLQKAPISVKDRPVSWQFIGPQEPGTMFIEWIPPSRTGHFPSDGFAWLDPERHFEKEVSEHFVS